jgi:hypothetical protein
VKLGLNRRWRFLLLETFLISLFSCLSLYANSNEGLKITDNVMSDLHEELDETFASKESSVRRRRDFKKVIRQGEKLFNTASHEERAFEVLAFVFKAKLGLLSIDNNSRNKNDLFETCKALIEAPDQFAHLRFDAEMMLQERDLTLKSAHIEVRTKALKELVEKYKNTPGELKSLISGIQMAPKIDAFELKNEFVKRLTERFAGEPQAIALRKNLMGAARMDILFKGSFQDLDGGTINFPMDRLGNPFMALFWSLGAPDVMEQLEWVKKQQDESPNRFDIFSFNLDEIEDAGAKVLKGVGLDCTILRLPDGKNSQTFKTYSLGDPSALLVNQYGHSIIPPNLESHKKNEAHAKAGDGMDHLRARKEYSTFNFPNQFLSEDRVVSQIQSIFIGDFLLNSGDGFDSMVTPSIPKEIHQKIRKILPRAPFRYRLSQPDVISIYENLDNACKEVISSHPEAKDLWRIMNYRIIALLGIHNISSEEAFFIQALELSKKVLDGKPPLSARVIPQFCIAKHRLRTNSNSAQGTIDEFIKACGGAKVGEEVFAAATVLTMHVDSRELFNLYKRKTLECQNKEKSSILEFISFLNSRFHDHYLFKGSGGYYRYSREYRFALRRYYIDNGDVPFRRSLPTLECLTLEGQKIDLSQTKNNKLTLLIFVEPPPSGNLHVSPSAYYQKKPDKKKKVHHGGLIASGNSFATEHVNKGLELVTIFLSDDLDHISAISQKYNWPGTITYLPNGLKNPLVKRLGINSADRVPHSILLRKDRSIAWIGEGLEYPHMRGIEHMTGVALDNHIARFDAEAGMMALKEKNYPKAKSLFSGPYLVNTEGSKPRYLHKWSSPRFFGRSISHIGLKDWDSALKDIDIAISEHLKYFNHDAAKPCSSLISMEKAKSKILVELGRRTEATSAKNRASVEETDYPTYYTRIRGYNKPYQMFDQRLSNLLKEMK